VLSSSRLAFRSRQQTIVNGTLLVTFLTVVHIINEIFNSMFKTYLPLFQERFGLSGTTLALLVAVFSFSSSVVQPLFGILSDHWDRRLIVASGLIINAIFLSLIGIVPEIYLLFGLLIVGGLGSAAFHPASTSLVRSVAAKNKNLAVSLFDAAGTLGYALGPVLILFIVSNFGLRSTPWLMTAGIILGVVVYLITPDQKQKSVAQPSASKKNTKFFDLAFFKDSIGLLTLTEVFASTAFITFSSAIGLWLVSEKSVARNSLLLSWTLAAFALAAALGGIVAGFLTSYLSHRLLISGSLLLAPLPLFGIFWLEPGSLWYFVAVMSAGALVNASLPLLIVRVQDLAPQAQATAAGMIVGFATGSAGLLYVGIGYLQELFGLSIGMSIGYLFLLPGSLIAFYVLTRYPSDRVPVSENLADCLCLACHCAIR
jgi:MFS transporter, FSR family, fosmidomycin resistance protein